MSSLLGLPVRSCSAQSLSPNMTLTKCSACAKPPDRTPVKGFLLRKLPPPRPPLSAPQSSSEMPVEWSTSQIQAVISAAGRYSGSKRTIPVCIGHVRTNWPNTSAPKKLPLRRKKKGSPRLKCPLRFFLLPKPRQRQSGKYQ